MRNHYIIKLFGKKILSINKNHLDIFRKVRQSLKLKKILDEHKDMPVFVMSPFIPYYSPMKQRFQHFAQLIAKKGYLVIYCTDYWCDRENCTELWDDFIEIQENLYLSNCFDVINKNIKNAWIYYTPIAWYSIDDFMLSKKNNKIVYDHIDNFNVDADKNKAQSNKERHKKIASLCDISSYSSKKLKDDLVGFIDNNKQVFIQNGVDYEHFAEVLSKEVPSELKNIISQGKTIIGYHGALTNNWIDFDLIAKTAQVYPEFNIVLIGSVCNEFDKHFFKKIVEENNNIYHFDAVSYEKLPQYTKYFDIAIIPFKHGEIALNTNPIKLFENMAMGIPTVVTRDLVECKGFEGVWVAEDDLSFLKYIKEAVKNRLSKDLIKKLKSYAKNNTWDSQVNKLIVAMNGECNGK